MNYIQKLLNAAKRADDAAELTSQLAQAVEEAARPDTRTILERNIDTTQNVVTNLEMRISAHELEIDRLCSEHREMCISRDGLAKALAHMRGNDLCRDEGCPQSGTDHVCNDPDAIFAKLEAHKYSKQPKPDDGQVTEVSTNVHGHPAPMVIKTVHTNIRGSKEEADAALASEKAVAEKIVNKVVRKSTRRVK